MFKGLLRTVCAAVVVVSMAGCKTGNAPPGAPDCAQRDV